MPPDEQVSLRDYMERLLQAHEKTAEVQYTEISRRLGEISYQLREMDDHQAILMPRADYEMKHHELETAIDTNLDKARAELQAAIESRNALLDGLSKRVSALETYRANQEGRQFVNYALMGGAVTVINIAVTVILHFF